MKKMLFILFIVMPIFSANAQTGNYITADSLPRFYIGLGGGLNNYTAMVGLSGNFRIYKKLFIQGGVGIGSWGTKSTIGLRFDESYSRGWSYGIGVSSCSGLKDLKTDLELKNKTTQEVTVDCLQAYTLNLKASYIWVIRKKNTFYLDFGYAVPLQKSPWRITDGSEISGTSEQVMDLVSPGGLIFGLGFTFGIL